ncbi:MAG: 50S ribosomal protein L4 [Chlamydiae bacterium]|nr:50S ribosomal protein L4 [Chlamydiota bacterium]
MATLKKYDLSGKVLGEVAIAEELLNEPVNSQMIKDYIVALRANKRQWSANTKGRSEVNHSTKKPHPQKGTGRARQGTLAAPQYKGGGRVFGPKPKFDQHVRINKKERRQAIKFLIAEKIKEGKVHVLKNEGLESPKTKVVSNFMDTLGLNQRRVLFLGEPYEQIEDFDKMLSQMEGYDVFIKSMRNIPLTRFMLAPNVSGYDVAVNHEIVIMEEALESLTLILGA